MSKSEWRNYTKIRDHLLNFGGIIFGGAVRDEILHNMSAKQFYKEHNEYFTSNPSHSLKKFEYSNKEISPHTVDRLVIPNDIDVMFDINKIDELIKFFTKFYKTQVCKVKDLSYFKKNIPPAIYTLFKVELLTQYKDTYYLVKIDMIGVNNKDNDEEDFYNIPLNYDFDINSLFWSKRNGIYSKDSIHSPKAMIHNSIVINDIYTNIRNKVAEMNPPFLWENIYTELPTVEFIHKENRIMKLKKTGWKIKILFVIYNFNMSATLNEDDSCIICLKNKSEIKCCVNFKKCNCKSIICLDCIKKEHSKILKCPTCREVVIADVSCSKYARNEIYAYENYVMDA